MRRWAPVIIAVVLFATTFLVYMRSLKADFVMWDDNVQLVDNQQLGGFSAARVVWAFTDVKTAARYIPLTLLGWIATYQFWERDPFGYHLGNNLLQCGSIVLAFFVLGSLLRRFGRSSAKLKDEDPTWVWLCAAMGALLWGWHPMRVEIVAWATTRTYCQSIFFLLMFLWLYIRMITASRWKGMYALTLTAYAMSLLSYPLGLTLPAALLVLDVYPFRRAKFRWDFWKDHALRRCVLEKIPMVAIALIVLVLGLMARTFQGGRYRSQLVSLDDFGIFERLMQACYLWVYYAWRPWWPVDLTPVRTELVWFSSWNWEIVASAIGLVVVTAALFFMRRRWPLALSLWLVHLIVLLPVLGWTERPHYPSDRYSTLQGLLWPFVIALVIWRLGMGGRHWKRIKGSAAAAAIIALLTTMTIRQVAVWHDSVSLFRYMISRLDPGDLYRADLHRRMGSFYATKPRPEYELAQQEFQRALEILPRDERVRLMMASLMIEQRRFDRAESVLRDGLAMDPGSTALRALLGHVFLSTRRINEALDQFNQVLQKDPNNPRAKQGIEAARSLSR